MSRQRLWKVLKADRTNGVANVRFKYPPDGVWAEHLDPDSLALCERGYHYCEGRQVLGWLREGLLAEVEACPEHRPLRGAGKSVSCTLRVVRTFPLDGRTLRLFACDCAERALRRKRRAGREPDGWSWEAVRVARRYADGKATEGELAAAFAAAYVAAYATAAIGVAYATAADAATAAATTAAIFADPATTAAIFADAASTAAFAAAAARAYDKERGWQYRRLLKLAGAT